MPTKDLVVLTACKNTQFAVQGILSRHLSLSIRSPSVDFFVHPNCDPGCAMTAAEFLRAQSSRYKYALVVFDREGSGREDETVNAIEVDVRNRLRNGGWDGRADVVVIDPELEAWVWSKSPHVERILGWFGSIPTLRAWLVQERFLANEQQSKPARPKEAMEAALEERHVRRSSALYKQLAEKVSLEHCADAAFVKLRDILRCWFRQ